MENKIESKIPFYEIANKFFVGAVFSILFVIITYKRLALIDIYIKYETVLKDWSVLVSAILLITMYEIGFIINRTSSVTISPILTKTKIWPTDNYDIDVSEIKQSNKTFNAMINNMIDELKLNSKFKV